MSSLPVTNQNNPQFELYNYVDILEKSQNYLILEHKPSGAIKLFDTLLEKGRKGILITRDHPQMFGNILPSKQIDTYWLSAENFDYVIHPWEIDELIRTIEDFVIDNNQGIILLNGLEYLSTYNNYDVITNLLFRMNEIVTNTNAQLLITIDPIALGNQFFSNIRNNSEITEIPSQSFMEALN